MTHATRFRDLLLIVSDKPDIERDAVARVWEAQGGEVLRLGRFWDPPRLDRTRVRVYGSDSFCMVLAQKLDLALVSPRDELIAELDRHWLQRDLGVSTLGQLTPSDFPTFVKPVTPKLFRAAVYPDCSRLSAECDGLEPNTPVLVSEIVSFSAEARAFVLDGEVLTCAVYEGEENVDLARGFAAELARAVALPRTCVLDIGMIADRGWGLIELNASWGSGLNGCDPLQAARCIACASGSRV